MCCAEVTRSHSSPGFGFTSSFVKAAFSAVLRERSVRAQAISATDGPDAIGTGRPRTVRWSLHKLVGEYARHNGHADLLRQRIDGATGE